MSSTRKRVLVTGGAGFLGSHLCERLVADRPEVEILAARQRLFSDEGE